MQNGHRPYVDQVPHRRVPVSAYELADLTTLSRRSDSLGELIHSLTPAQAAWLVDVVNVMYRAGYRDGAKAADDLA